MARILKDALESKTILKVLHDCRSAVNALKKTVIRCNSKLFIYKLNIHIHNKLDTQIMFSELITSEKRPTLNAILGHFNLPQNPLKAVVDTRNEYWKQRPFTGNDQDIQFINM